MTHEEFKTRYLYDPATDKLGEGGFGKVFKAYDTYLDRWVAIKIASVNPQYESVRLRKEVEMVSRLPVHPNIARYEECYTFSSFDGEYDFGILQYYEEGNLLQLIQNEKLSLAQKESLLKQILSGLAFLHDNGIIHRDLKPQNILIVKRKEGTFVPKITDFGISKKLEINKSSVFNNSLAGAGTLSYSSPEQLGDLEIRKNTDLWSFGVIAFQVLTGQLPFSTGGHATTSESGRQELFSQINSGKFPDTINDIPKPWQTLIQQCLLKEVAQRVKNCKEATAILQGETQAKPDETTKLAPKKQTKVEPAPVPPLPNANSPKRKNLKQWYVLYGIAIVLLFFFLFYLGNNPLLDKQIPEVTEPEQAVAEVAAIDMVFVEGGTFTMGCTAEQGNDCDGDEKPAHLVTLSDFYIGKYEVTQAQWKAVMDSNPSYFKEDNLPVEQVSWNDVQAFIKKLNTQTGKHYRLPTEAEWEYAARGGKESTGAKYSGSSSPDRVAWYGNYNGQTHPVGTKAANELGIYDMSGNVYERCSDWYGNYNSNTQTNPTGASSGSYRVFRGGSWYDNAQSVRVPSRYSDTPDVRSIDLGFRLASSSN
jgi:formylglycine-generating enzyme required for sulfatase activity